jgi:hypothetical protein
MLRRTPLAVACILLGVIGCTSMTSTMLTRDESNRFWTRKSGLKGVPITLKVPTHIQLTVFERYFFVNDDDGRARRIQLPYVVRDFSQEFIYSEKIFTVDFKHPASGTYNLHLGLTEDQYVQKLQYDVTDTTIQDVTKLVQRLAPGGFGAQTVSDEQENYYEMQSVVAVGMFEIDAPDFEEQMSTFLNCHLNQAHDAWVVPPNVKTMHRSRLSGFKQESNICEGLVVPDDPAAGPAAAAPEAEALPPPAIKSPVN